MIGNLGDAELDLSSGVVATHFIYGKRLVTDILILEIHLLHHVLMTQVNGVGVGEKLDPEHFILK